jgi:hypothetical protein
MNERPGWSSVNVGNMQVSMSTEEWAKLPQMSKKIDGLLMTRWDATIRYLTLWETLLFNLFGKWPHDAHRIRK